MKICLNDIPNLKRFVNTATSLGMRNVDLVSGRYVIAATSIMGLLSLDLTKPIELVETTMTNSQIDRIKAEFADIISY